MGQYNWEANTRSWAFQASYDPGKAGLVKGLRAVMDYTNMDYDDDKMQLLGHAKSDRDYFHADIWYRFSFLTWKQRFVSGMWTPENSGRSGSIL
jgi:hypothetical protein